jgi:hypothetical protein
MPATAAKAVIGNLLEGPVKRCDRPKNNTGAPSGYKRVPTLFRFENSGRDAALQGAVLRDVKIQMLPIKPGTIPAAAFFPHADCMRWLQMRVVAPLLRQIKKLTRRLP